MFAEMTPSNLAVVAAVTRASEYAHGERLFRAGDACDGVTVAVDGFVRLFRLAPDGAEATIGIVRPGGFVAVASLRGEAVHDHAAEALGYVRAVEVPAATLLALARRSPDLFAAITRGLWARTDDAYAAAAVDRQGELPTRILHALRRLARPSRVGGGAAVDPVCPLAIRLSHAEVARLVGADRASVTRAFRRLGEEGLIRRERGHVIGVALAASDDAACGPGRTPA